MNKPQGKVVALLLAGVLIFGLIFTGINQVQKNTANAALNCPAGSTAVGNNCQYNATAGTPSYTCPNGGTVTGSNCVYNGTQVYSCATGTVVGSQCSYNGLATPKAATCPYGGALNPIDCVSNPICVFAPGATSCIPAQPCVSDANYAWSTVDLASFTYCKVSATPSSALYFCENGGIQTSSVCRYVTTCTALSAAGACIVRQPCQSGWNPVGSFNDPTNAGGYCERSAVSTPSNLLNYSCPSGGSASGSTCYYAATPVAGAYTCPLGGTVSGTSCIYAGTAGTPSYTCPSGGTVSGTVCILSATSYTPTNGQITGLTCTPTNPPAGSNVSCSGQATGNPNYPTIPYSGSITVTIDNGGGNATTTLNSDGTFTATGITVGTVPGTSNVTKTATTNLGGSASINVTSTVPNFCTTTCTSGTNMNGSLTGTISSAVSGTITFPEATNIPSGTPGVFTGAGSGCTINGAFTTVVSGGVVFTPTGNVPAGCSIGAQTGSLTTTGLTTNPTASGVPSNFTPSVPGITDPLFIDPSKITFTPIESVAVKFGSADLTLTVGGGNAGALNDPRFTANSTTATCKFRLKEYGVLDSDTTSKGFDLSTAKLAGSVADLDLTNNSFDVAYSATTGCSVKLPLGAAQNQPKWFFEIRVVRSDGQVFGQNMSYFMTYGAIGGVAVS
ncbi:MAG: hypothetical protein WCK98_04100 [bacterium]